MAKILKNTTGSDIDLDILGRRVPALGELELDTSDFLKLASEESISELTTYITSGDIIVNDGTADLSTSTGLILIKYPNKAEDLYFNNDSTDFTSSNTRDAIIESLELAKASRFQYLQFQFIGQMNYDQYLYSGAHNSSTRRSGDASNGYRYSNSAPLNVAFSGNIQSATASIRGIAQSTGTPAANMELKFELWKVGMSGSEGTKLGDIIFNIVSASYTIGNYWNSSIVTQFEEAQDQDVDVTAGDLLGLKFIRQTGNDKVVSIENTTIVLELIGEV